MSVFFLLPASRPLLACRPAANHRYPTLEENFRTASAVAFVTVLKSGTIGTGKTSGSYGSDVEFETRKVWKGSLKPKFSLRLNSSSCDSLAQVAGEGASCVLFFVKENQIISGVLSGVSSSCAPANTSAANKDFEKEWTELLAPLTTKK